MTEPEIHPLEFLLQRIAISAPAPWYPSVFSQESGTPRDDLDRHLDRLRLAGLVQLTDWVQGRGQGYVITPEGEKLLHNPRLLRRWIDGNVTLRPIEPLSAPLERGTPLRSDEMMNALRDGAPPRATWTLIIINIAVFVAGLAMTAQEHGNVSGYIWGPSSKMLVREGALSGIDFYQHQQWWRLLSCCFVHIGLIHLGVNMYSLYVIGPLLERMWGTARFLLLYLIAGIAGSCGMLLESPGVVGAGASGAIWGILASMVSWLILYRHVMPAPLRRHWVNQLVIIFVLNLAITFGVRSISKGAHFGGGLAGFLVAFPLDYWHFAPPGRRWLAALGVAAVPAVALGLVVDSIHKEQRAQQEVADLNRHIPAAVRAVEQAEALVQNVVAPLLAASPEKRDPMQAVAAMAALRQVKQELDEAHADLAATGPYTAPRVRQARSMTLEVLQQESDLLQLAEQALGEKENPEQALSRFREREQSVARLRDAWLSEFFAR